MTPSLFGEVTIARISMGVQPTLDNSAVVTRRNTEPIFVPTLDDREATIRNATQSDPTKAESIPFVTFNTK